MQGSLDRRAFLAAAASTPLLAITPALASAGSYPAFDLKADFGAGGEGQTNDTPAFQKAAAALMKAGGGVLTIPPGVYIVGEQYANQNHVPGRAYYQHAKIFSVKDLALLQINGYGAKLQIKSGLRYGGFDLDGNAIDITNVSAQDPGRIHVAHVGRVFEIVNCNNVWIRGIKIDGNNTALELGGRWGVSDRQANGTGIWLNRCPKASITEAYVHHHALDGIAILHLGEKPLTRKQHYIIRTRSEYNGRQALSWIGGNGLECRDSKFNHTGRAINHGGGEDDNQALFSAPGAGVDIEPNAGAAEWTRNGLFSRCEFINNAGAGMLADKGDGGYSIFDDCTFWGTTYFSIWAARAGLKFRNCRIYGTGTNVHDGALHDGSGRDPALATAFTDCIFEDVAWTNGTVYRPAASLYLYVAAAGADGATWTDCTFNARQVRSIYAGNPTSPTPATHELFDGCIFMHRHSALAAGGMQASFRSSRLRGCQFMESSAVSAGSRNYYIHVAQAEVLDGAATHIDGPRVRWRNPTSGLTQGDIPPGTYTS